MAIQTNALLAPDPQFPEPGTNSSPLCPDLREVNWFTEKQVRFLQEFAKHLDINMAADAVGVPQKSAQNWCQTQKMRDEINAIYDAWRKAIRMTAEHSSGRFLTILDKIEAAFDAADPSEQGKLGNALIKGASDYLKATGHFDKSCSNKTAPPMQFNIHIGGTAKVKTVKDEKTNQSTVEVQCE